MSSAATTRRYKQANPEKAECHRILNRAVRQGEIVRPAACQKCGASRRLDGHHSDYSLPLAVIWPCRSCHVREHPEVYGPRYGPRGRMGERANRVELIVQDVPARVLARLQADAKQRDVSVNEAVNGVLAAVYNIRREPTGAKFTKALTRPTLLLDMPDGLHRAVKMAAAGTKGATMRGLIIKALADNYGVPVPAPARRARTTRR